MHNNTLTKLPNIGKTLAEKLAQIEITTEQALKVAGSENALIKICPFVNVFKYAVENDQSSSSVNCLQVELKSAQKNI